MKDDTAMMTDGAGDPADPAVLLRYIEGRSLAGEREAVEGWLAADAARRAELARLERAWRLAAELPRFEFDVDANWERLRRELDVPAAAPSEPPAPVAVGGRASAAARQRWRPARIAVRVGLLAATVAFALLYFDDVKSKLEAALEPPMKTYTTEPGQVGRLTLSDGSKVVLSGGSTLGVPGNYGRRAREVQLEGGAYFEVVHDPSNVFRVRTPRMVVEDRGTRFTVLAYAHEPDAQVAVAEGVVAVAASDTAEAVVLNPQDVATVSAAGVVNAMRGVAVDKYFSWIDGTVQFDQDYVADAARVIERHFGVRIQIADSALARRRFTGAVRAASLYDDLRGLALLLDAEYERSGRVVTLSLKSAARTGTGGGAQRSRPRGRQAPRRTKPREGARHPADPLTRILRTEV